MNVPSQEKLLGEAASVCVFSLKLPRYHPIARQSSLDFDKNL